MTVSINGSGGLTFNDGTIQSTVGYVPFRNRIINGDMQIDQRNNGAALNGINPAAGGTYIVDRWLLGSSLNGKFNAGKNLGGAPAPAGFIAYLGLVSAAATVLVAGDYSYVSQRIEAANVIDLGWGTASAKSVTFSFLVYSSITGTHSGSLQNDDTTRSYPFTFLVNAANTWEVKSITVPGDTTGVWRSDNSTGIRLQFNLGTGATFLGPAGAWSGANYVGATGSVNVCGTNGAKFLITGVQLEAGSTGTPFERRPYGLELAQCQRYYELCRASVRGFATGVSQFFSAPINFAVTKRATPTLAVAAAGVSNILSGGVPDAAPASLQGFRLNAQSSTSGDCYALDYLISASSEL